MIAQLILNIGISASHIVLVAAGFSLIYQATRCFHFAHAAVYSTGAYVAYAVVNHWGAPNWFGLGIGMVSGGLLGGIIELAVYRPLRKVGATSIMLMLASLGLLIVIQNIISVLFGDETRAVSASSTVLLAFHLMGVRITMVQMILVATAITTMVLFGILRSTTQLGLIEQAVADDEALSRTVGIDVDNSILMSLVIGSATAAVAGILWGYNTAIQPQMGFTALLVGVVAALIGGIGSITGMIIASLLIASIQQVVIWNVPSHWQDVPVFVVLVLFLLVRPQGVLGKSLTKAVI